MPAEKSRRGSGRGDAKQSGQPVHQRDGELAGGQQREDTERHQRPIGYTICPRHRQQTSGEQHREQRHRTQVQQQGRSAGPAPQSRGQGKARMRGAFQLEPALVDQVVPDVRRPVCAALPGCTRPRQLDGAARYRVLGESADPCDFLDDVAVAVTAREIHRDVGGARVRAQGLLDHAHGLDELAPVHRPEKAQTADAVAYRDLVGRLLLVAGAHQLLDAQAGLGQLLLDPRQRQGQCEALSLQAAREFRNEGAVIGGFDRAMSAITRIRFFGSSRATSVNRRAQSTATSDPACQRRRVPRHGAGFR